MNVIPELRAVGAFPDDATAELAMFASPAGFPDFMRRQAFFA